MTVTYFTPPGEGEQRRGLMPLGLFLFFGGHLPQTSAFRSAKQILVVSFATQARAFILSDCNIFYAPRGWGEEQRRGLMPLGLFLFFFCFVRATLMSVCFVNSSSFSSYDLQFSCVRL